MRKDIPTTLAFLLLLSAGSAKAAPSIEAGFSPEGSAQKLVLETINSAHSSIQMVAYAFQAKDITKALDAAQQRGVSVQVVIDKHRNRGHASLAAMRDVVSHGVALRIDGHYHIQHDKMMIVDGSTLETGSFNYAKSAEYDNSENVLVIKNMPKVVAQYQQHFASRWAISQPFDLKAQG
ncbi:phospholipase D family protein [Kluyvera intermedia]|uniref:phospholipase D family nuclease n=1 Tax=Kluyvera intermedia TaxID=61648 RepID=UPI000789022F|nr:phospholipase D family protein [Kluyvera intermedia]WQD28009.1 phospholipase D family protein [Kluyvera intermedia]VDZ83542.1 Phospholipase D precursor [Kluyvera intermedia]